jgi:hypothetical protein
MTLSEEQRAAEAEKQRSRLHAQDDRTNRLNAVIHGLQRIKRTKIVSGAGQTEYLDAHEKYLRNALNKYGELIGKDLLCQKATEVRLTWQPRRSAGDVFASSADQPSSLKQ